MQGSICVRPLCDALGVEVGLDAGSGFSDDAADELRQLFARHKLLLFRGASLKIADQVRIVSLFAGVLEDDIVVSNRKGGSIPTGELQFHSDLEYTAEPIWGVSLYAQEVGPDCAATKFANARRAAATLPASLARSLEGRRALHRFGYAKLKDVPEGDPSTPQAWHPVLREDSFTHEPVLFVTAFQTVRIEGMETGESESLLTGLQERLYARDNIYVHRWEPNDLVVWNNVSLQHARDDVRADASPRKLRRVSFGDRRSFDYLGYIPSGPSADYRSKPTAGTGRN